MRVVLLGDFPSDPNRISGGPQAVLSYMVRGFRSQPDIEVHVISPTSRESRDRTEDIDGARIHYIAHPRLPVELIFLWLRHRVHRKIRELDPDIVHAHNARLFSWLAVTSGYPSAVVAHGIHGTVHQYKTQFVDRVRHALRDKVLLRHFETDVEHLICISPYIEEGYRGRTRAKTYAIENPIDDSFFNLDPLQYVPGQVLCAGLLIKRKNPQLLIDAVADIAPEFPGMSVQFAGGSVDSNFASGLQRAVNLAGLDHQVSFLGQLNEEEIVDAYQKAQIVVLPSNQETSPMVIQQAMAAGKPVIAARTGGIPNLIEHGKTGYLIDRGDQHALSNSLRKLLMDPDLAQAMGQRARVDAETRFRASAVAGMTAHVYREILGGEFLFARQPEVIPVTRVVEAPQHGSGDE